MPCQLLSQRQYPPLLQVASLLLSIISQQERFRETIVPVLKGFAFFRPELWPCLLIHLVHMCWYRNASR